MIWYNQSKGKEGGRTVGFSVKIHTLDVPGDILVKLATVWGQPGYCVGMHTHHTLEISMILSGKGEYRLQDRVYPVEAGDIVLFNNTEIHGMWSSEEEPLVNMALEFEPRFIWSDPLYSFDQAFLSMFFSRNEHFQHKLDRSNPAYPSIKRQLEEIQTEFQNQLPRYDMIIKAKLLSLLADLLRHYDITQPSDSLTDTRHHGDMNRVLNYIADHYADPLTLEQLADMLHVSESYFCQLFRKSNGLSPKEYIVKVRTAAAAQQLKETDRSVLDIAENCGFNSPSNFYAAFKRITGKSPNQYRANPLD